MKVGDVVRFESKICEVRAINTKSAELYNDYDNFFVEHYNSESFELLKGNPDKYELPKNFKGSIKVESDQEWYDLIDLLYKNGFKWCNECFSNGYHYYRSIGESIMMTEGDKRFSVGHKDKGTNLKEFLKKDVVLHDEDKFKVGDKVKFARNFPKEYVEQEDLTDYGYANSYTEEMQDFCNRNLGYVFTVHSSRIGGIYLDEEYHIWPSYVFELAEEKPSFLSLVKNREKVVVNVSQVSSRIERLFELGEKEGYEHFLHTVAKETMEYVSFNTLCNNTIAFSSSTDVSEVYEDVSIFDYEDIEEEILSEYTIINARLDVTLVETLAEINKGVSSQPITEDTVINKEKKEYHGQVCKVFRKSFSITIGKRPVGTGVSN
jgi:hypothetical protein